MSDQGHHLVVIMARGDSLRMGYPKGLCRQAGQERKLVERVLDLYAGLGWRVLVVLRQEDEGAYRRALREHPVDFLVCPRGGDTARTLGHALLWQKTQAPGITHLWAHPVDLPAVRRETVHALREALIQDQPQVLRPSLGGEPGHPVIFSVAALEPLERVDPGDISMQRFWRQAGLPAMVMLPVTDPGVVQDFDHPAALQAAPSPKEGPA